MEAWGVLSAGQKTTWDEYVDYCSKGAMSGFNLFLSEYIQYIRDESADPPQDPWDFT